MVSENNADYFVQNLPCMSLHQPIKSSDSYKSHMNHGELLYYHLCKKII